ncbi:hypothetical protein ACNS7O_14730 (plasmid) [Haloferacaceae archaeon DSL9]
MVGFPSLFGDDGGGLFDDYASFVPEHVPDPGEFLDGHDVLVGEDHATFHRITRGLFEERKVYDMTFNYNLARLNLDTRHPDAGYRYAEAADDPSVLRAEFTPTTPFCPQAHTLAIGSFRAWNGLADRHDYELVRVHPMHRQADAINDQLAEIEETFVETGSVANVSPKRTGSDPMQRAARNAESSRGESEPPF